MPKFVKLLTSAYVNGLLRHPHEGVLHLEDDQADRLIEDKAGEDVTADFSSDDRKGVPVESIEAADDRATAAAKLDPVEHQANITPNAAEGHKPEPAKTGRAGKPAD